MMTNRQWLHALTDEQFAKFLTVGLRVKSKHYIGFPFDISIADIANNYTSSAPGIEKWLSMPQDYEVVKGGTE